MASNEDDHVDISSSLYATVSDEQGSGRSRGRNMGSMNNVDARQNHGPFFTTAKTTGSNDTTKEDDGNAKKDLDISSNPTMQTTNGGIAYTESIEMTTTAYYDKTSPRHIITTTNSNNVNSNIAATTTTTSNSTPTPTPNPTPTSTPTQSNTKSISFTELSYGISSYHVIVLPVTITMILSALAVTYIQSPQIDTSSSLNSQYNVFKVSDEYSVGTNLGLSLVNALVIVSVVAAATFLLVLLYKYRCMKCLFGYMILSSAALLGLLGTLVSMVTIQKYQIPIDKITFYFLIANFAIVGTISIFYSRGIPTYITQSYLVITSVILAWQLSQFNDWTAWSLLVMLALYDLCAVLTPCGPLKALVGLMSKDDAPELPGLLYEAQLPNGVQRPNMRNRNATNNSNSRDNGNPNGSNGNSNSNSSNSRSGGGNGRSQGKKSVKLHPQNANDNTLEKTQEKRRVDTNNYNQYTPNENRQQQRQQQQTTHSNRNRDDTNTSALVNPASSSAPPPFPSSSSSRQPHRTGSIPLAIAIIYKLPILSPPEYVTHDNSSLPPPSVRRGQYSPFELTSNVIVRFPRHGGYIEVKADPEEQQPEESTSNSASRGRSFFGRLKKKQDKPKTPPRYVVYDRHGNTKRELVVNDEGRVFEAVQVDDGENGHGGGGALASNSIKLGLGDFIFYSVLVSKAAQYSFTTFAACVLVILAGLGGTLVLLSVYHKALPALPISIFLGVAFYFLTRAAIEPYFIEAVFESPFYV